VLVSDRAFAGSDSWSTSYTLSQAIRQMSRFDLIVAGERATDGDTGQVGPGMAAWLDVPLATYVAAITRVEPEEGRLTVERLVEEGYQVLELHRGCRRCAARSARKPPRYRSTRPSPWTSTPFSWG